MFGLCCYTQTRPFGLSSAKTPNVAFGQRQIPDIILLFSIHSRYIQTDDHHSFSMPPMTNGVSGLPVSETLALCTFLNLNRDHSNWKPHKVNNDKLFLRALARNRSRGVPAMWSRMLPALSVTSDTLSPHRRPSVRFIFEASLLVEADNEPVCQSAVTSAGFV